MPWVDGWIQYLPFPETNMAPKTLGFGRWIPFLGPQPTWQILCVLESVISTDEAIVVLTGIDRAGSIPKHGWIFVLNCQVGDPAHCRVLHRWNRKTFPFKCEDTLFLIHFVYIYIYYIRTFSIYLNTYIYIYTMFFCIAIIHLYLYMLCSSLKLLFQFVYEYIYIYIDRHIWIFIYLTLDIFYIYILHRNTQITSQLPRQFPGHPLPTFRPGGRPVSWSCRGS